MLRDINWKKFDEIMETGDSALLEEFVNVNGLVIKNGKIYAAYEDELDDALEYYDKRQLVKKIALNSLYGGLLNEGSRYNDFRLGQSTTLTGRQIVKHMTSETNKFFTGEYDYLGESIISGDTDSVYFTAYPILKDEIDNGKIKWDKDSVVKLYDTAIDDVNNTFADFMFNTFNCPKSRGSVIKAGREVVGETSIFIAKKRYAIMVYDKEGSRKDINGKPGEIKAMGLDLKRSDTPVFIQQFLMHVLEQVLTDIPEADTLEFITEFRKQFKELQGWEKGSPKRANNITSYTERAAKGKVTIPGHVHASMNWNTLKKMYSDMHAPAIADGAKVVVCKLKPSPLGFKSVAYPTDEMRLPEWFKTLPFDHDSMETLLIDDKLDNLIGILKYDLSETLQRTTFNKFF